MPPSHSSVTPSLPPVLPEPVSQVQVDFTLQDRESGPRAEMSCQASSGSPPISYLLVGKNGRVYMQQRPHHGQPANFQLSGMWGWFQCQAENSVSVQSSAFKLVPPGEAALLCWEGPCQSVQ